MKKLLIIPALLFALLASAQSDCLQTSCVAVHARVGDTVQLGAVFTTSNKVASLVFTQVSGPNTAVQLNPVQSYVTSLGDTARMNVTGLAAGTYVFEVVGKDQSGGQAAPGYDSIVVTPAVAQALPVITGATISILGQTLTIPPGVGTKITYTLNGVTQTVTF